MVTVQNVLDFMESLCPANLKTEWDNTGFHCGSRHREVHKILLALDPFLHVCQEAVDIGADMLITHHPLLFHPAEAVTDDTPVGRCLMLLLKNGISTFNAHTNLDCAPGGVNDVLAELLGLQNITPLACDSQGLLRQGTVETQTLKEFMAKVKATLGTPVLRYADGGRSVSRVAVGGGSCGSELWMAAKAGCDTFVTADVKYNQFWDATDSGINIIDAGHFFTENPIIAVLAGKLQDAFPQIQVEISKTHKDCMKFYG